jgi:acyl-ACP thioesterase
MDQEVYNIEDNTLGRTYMVRSYEVDAGGRLSVPSIFNFLQDAASSHALKLGVAVSQLQANNYTWVLSRIILKMDTYPQWGDTIQIHTWPSGIEGAFAFRDFDLRRDDQTIGKCISAWIIIDTGKRRPVRPKAFAQQLKPVDKDHVLDQPLAKIPALTEFQSEKQFQVRYHDLDINQHVNNVNYIEWLLECCGDYHLNNAVLSDLSVNFLGEALLHDHVRARCQTLDADRLRLGHDIRRETDGQELIRAQTTWRITKEE